MAVIAVTEHRFGCPFVQATIHLSAPNSLVRGRGTREMINLVIATIARSRAAICGKAKLDMVEQGCLGRGQFLIDYAIEGYVAGTPKFWAKPGAFASLAPSVGCSQHFAFSTDQKPGRSRFDGMRIKLWLEGVAYDSALPRCPDLSQIWRQYGDKAARWTFVSNVWPTCGAGND